MRFSLKVVIGTMLIVVIMFSLSGIILIHENFKNSYRLQIKTNLSDHIIEKYSIESNIHENILEDGTVDLTQLEKYLYTLTSYLGNSRKLSIFINDKRVWNNVPFEVLDNNCEDTCVKTYESKKYSILKSRISINNENILIISVYDVSGVFEVRNQNLLEFYIIDIILLTLCSFLTMIFAKFLTKPIKILNETTKLVAAGDLDVKIDIKGNDEIGELSSSFTSMIESIKRRQKELELSLKQREDFISNFTHELKTPMTSIMGYTKILKQDKYSKVDKEKALNYIYSETKRLEILSRKLLDLMGLNEKQIVLDNISIKQLFQEIQDLTMNRFQNINLSLDIKEATIIGDKDLLITCIMNLIENAYKASNGSGEIRIIGKSLFNKYKISIIDRGIGMEEEEIHRITEDFYMVDRSRGKIKGGYGLGLGLCSKILKFHNTKLFFKSKIDRGTEVSFDLEVSKNENE